MSISQLFTLEGKRALVTGGGSGLGLAIAEVLTELGAEVIIVGRRKEKLVEACTRLGNKVSYRVFDLSSDLSGIGEFVDELITTTGPIDILVNNAGINLKKEVLDVTDEDFASVIRTNQQAVFAMTRAVAKTMIERRAGSIIMISSMAAIYGIPKVVAYTASKAAIEGMTRALTVELSPKGIRVNCVAPGFIETDMSARALNNDPERKNKVLSRTPMGYLGKPADIGTAVAFLASDAAKYITGVVLPVDGGNSIGF